MRNPIHHRLATILVALLLGSSLLAAPSVEEEKPADKKQEDAATKEEAPAEEDADEEEEEEEEDRFFAVVGGDVHTVTGGVLRGATLLAKNGKIERIGYGVTVPEEADVLDATGLRVYPGLIACNSTSIVGSDPPELNTDVFALNLVLGLASGMTTVITGNSAAKLTYGTLEDHVLRKNLFTRVDVNSTTNRRKFREDMDKVRAFRRELADHELAIALGEESEEPKPEKINQNYLKLVKGEAVARFDRVNDADDLRWIAQASADYGFEGVIYGAQEGWVVADELGRAKLSCVVAPRTVRTRDENSNQPNGARIENAALLHESGVPVAVLPRGTGIALWGLVGQDLFTLPVEAAYAVRGGMDRQAALESITITAARILGIDDQVGSLEVGKDADVILTDGDVLHYETMVHFAVVNGRLVYEKAEESLLSHIRALEDTDRFQAAELIEALEEIHPPEEEGEESEDGEDGEAEEGEEGEESEEPSPEEEGEGEEGEEEGEGDGR